MDITETSLLIEHERELSIDVERIDYTQKTPYLIFVWTLVFNNTNAKSYVLF